MLEYKKVGRGFRSRRAASSKRASVLVIMVTLAMSLGGCTRGLCESDSAIPAWAVSCAQLAELPPGSRQAHEATQDLQRSLVTEMQADLRRQLDRSPSRPMAAAPPTRRVLLLSGGGQLGAYGAGSLVAWTARDDRPEFDIVTGVSTGALIATFAFLGSEYDHVLTDGYTQITTRDILQSRPLLCLPLADSLATTDGLRRLIEKQVTMDVLDAVAAEYARGRSLWIGVVELKTGLFLPVNLGEIASRGDPAALRDYRDAVLASASIPVMFPPVCRGGFAFVDGGTRQNIFFPGVCNAVRGRHPESVTLYALVNGTVGTSSQFDIRGSLTGIGSRSLELLMQEAEAGALFRIESVAREQDWQFRIASMLPGDCEAARRNCRGRLVNLFCQEYMRCLFSLAGSRIADHTFWRLGAGSPPGRNGETRSSDRSNTHERRDQS